MLIFLVGEKDKVWQKKLILFGIFLKQVPRIQVGVSEVLGPKNLDGNLNKVAWKGLR